MNEDGAPTPTTLIDLLNELVEPPEPAPVTMTPQTWGWAVLAGLLALAVFWLAWRAWCRWRSNAYRRAALAELSAAGDDPATIAAILRRTSLAAWPRERVASLTGRDWLLFLDATGGGGAFADGRGAALADAPYRGRHAPVPGLGEIAARWVRRHRIEAAA
jgi:Domain of unknown function (DUF4381)